MPGPSNVASLTCQYCLAPHGDPSLGREDGWSARRTSSRIPSWGSARCPCRSVAVRRHFQPKLDTCKVWPHGQHQGQDHRDHRRRPRHRLRDRQGTAGPRRAGGHRRPRRGAPGVGRRRPHQARPGLRLSARRHRPGIVRDVPRQGAHRRRRPHRRADQQRRRDADRSVPRAVRAGDPLLDRGQSLRRAHRMPAGAARTWSPAAAATSSTSRRCPD